MSPLCSILIFMIKGGFVKKNCSIKQENIISCLDVVHVVENILPHNVCDWIIERAEHTASSFGGWVQQNRGRYPTTDIFISTLDNCDKTIITNIIYHTLFPLIASKFKIAQYLLEIKDVRIVKYSMDEQTGVDEHVDSTLFTFSIQLNDTDNFKGGGIRFTDDDIIYQCNKSDVLIHCGKKKHAGVNITEGVRYILVGFIYYPSTETNKDKQRDEFNLMNKMKKHSIQNIKN
jgi:hypothetical protein